MPGTIPPSYRGLHGARRAGGDERGGAGDRRRARGRAGAAAARAVGARAGLGPLRGARHPGRAGRVRAVHHRGDERRADRGDGAAARARTGCSARCSSRRTPHRTADIRRDPRFRGWWPSAHPQMRSFLGVPIVARGEVIAAFYLTDREGAAEFSAEDQRLIEMLAAHAAVAIENARLAERGRELSIVEERNRLARELHDSVSPEAVRARAHRRGGGHAARARRRRGGRAGRAAARAGAGGADRAARADLRAAAAVARAGGAGGDAAQAGRHAAAGARARDRAADRGRRRLRAGGRGRRPARGPGGAGQRAPPRGRRADRAAHGGAGRPPARGGGRRRRRASIPRTRRCARGGSG